VAAFLIADVDVLDADAFEEYKRDVPATEQRYGGRYLGATRIKGLFWFQQTE